MAGYSQNPQGISTVLPYRSRGEIGQCGVPRSTPLNGLMKCVGVNLSGITGWEKRTPGPLLQE